MLAVNTLKPITEGAKGIVAVALGTQDAEFESRTSRLHDMTTISDALGRNFWILVGGVAALFSASFLVATDVALPPHTDKVAELTATVASAELVKPAWLESAHPAIVYSGLLGAVLVMVYAGGVLQAAGRCMRRVVLEIDRQLGGFPKERGKFRVPDDYIPSYRACIEIVAHGALSRHMLPVLSAVLLPILLGPLLSIATGGAPGVVRAALASFVLTGAVTGLTAAFAAQAVHSYVGGVRRQVRGKPGSAESALQAGGFAQLCGAAAGPAAQLVLKTVAVGSLAVAPFLS
jgi:Na+/H+-translocating membrane pyrophosphatase